MPSSKVAIIGGGLSGLATAVFLHRLTPQLSLTLFESNSRLGGVIHTKREGDFLVDHGADMFATNPPPALELFRSLGVEKQLIKPKTQGRGARIVLRGKTVDIPAGFVLMRATQNASVLQSPLLSWDAKTRFLTEQFAPPAELDEDDDISVADFVRHRYGQEMLDALVGPLVAGIYTADAEKLSMRATMRPILEMEQQYGSLAKATQARIRRGDDSIEQASSGARYEQFRAFRNGTAQLIETLAKQLPTDSVKLNSTVQSIRRSSEGWQIEQDQHLTNFDHVVVATPASIAARLLADVSERASSDLASIRFASTAIVILGIPRKNIQADINTFGFVVPPREKRKVLAVSFASNKFAYRAPDDQVLVRVFIGGMLQPELLDQDDASLIEIAKAELADLIQFSGGTTLEQIVRWNNAMPQYEVGHLRLVERIDNALDSVPNLSLINNAIRGVGIAPVIQEAGRVAEKVISSGASGHS